jgi:signal transduction histidine kinase
MHQYYVDIRDRMLDEMKRGVGFGKADIANLRSLAKPLEQVLDRVADQFYDALRGCTDAMQVFKGGEEQIRRLRVHLVAWLKELFVGQYDVAYFQNCGYIGHVHLHVHLPQHFMITGMEVIRSELERHILAKRVAQARAKIDSVNKLLALELATMLEAYKDHYTAHIRDSEREAMEERLTKAEHMAQIGSLAASLAHAIKNPLAGISGAIQVIRGNMPADSPHNPIIDEMLDQIDRLDATVRDLLVYSRPPALARGRLDLNELIARVLNVLREEPALRRIRVVHVRQDPLPEIQADERHLEQVIMNVLLNAADASAEGDKVVITTSFDGCVRMSIVDTGVGMNGEALRRSFEPFYTTKTKGTGLGLSISRQIVDAHNGRIVIESKRQRGTTVTVELPVDKAPDRSTTTASTP